MLGPKADPNDVVTVDALIAALYESISFLPYDQPDYRRWRSLFADAARVYTGNSKNGPYAIDAYLQSFHQSLFEAGDLDRGLIEEEIDRRGEDFGNIVNIFSGYAAWRTAADNKPFGRGVNSIQLLGQEGRWWIVNVIWDDERADDPNYTPEYAKS